MSKKNNLAKRKKQYEFDLQSAIRSNLSSLASSPFPYPISIVALGVFVV